jgi:hypothetical protein
MLQSAYRNGDLDLDSQGNFIRVNPVPQSEFKVEEGFEPAEPTGFNVMRGDKVLFSTQNEAEAKAKAKTLGDSAAPIVKQVEKSIANEQNMLNASQRSLDIMEANGKFGTPEYDKASAKHSALVEESAKKVENLNKTKEHLQQEVTVKAGKKAANVKAFTTKEKGVSEKSFATREEALQHAIENHTVARLNEIAAETKSPGLKARISKELERRKNPKPFLAAEKPVQEPVQKTAEKPTEETLVTAQKESIKSNLLPMLKRFGLGDVALQIEAGMKAEGSYAGSLIKVALDANNPIRVLRHESLHGLKDLGFFTKGQWGVLENQADKVWIDKYLKERNIDGQPLKAGQQSRYEAYVDLYKGDMQAVREEAIADAFGDFDVNGAPKGLFATLLNNMRQFFEALRNSFNGAGYMTSDDVFGKIERGELSAGNKAGTTEKQSLTSGNAFDKAEVAKANAYEEKNGIAPYLSAGDQYLPTTGGEKYSLKTKDKYGMYEGIPLNKDGTITVYYHTTKADAMDINKAKRISPSDDKRVYLTNESSGALVLKDKGLLPQETDGSVVMLKLPPEMMQFADKYPDGRVDMFIPLAEGDFFDKKMRVSAIQVSKDTAILGKGQTFSYKDHAARMSGALTAYEGLSAEGKEQAVKRAAAVLREQHNIGTLLTTNGKLEKTSPEAEGLSDLDVNASSMGLGLASAQKITEKLSSCPNSAICVDLCLGDTAGGNQQYGGVAKEDVGDIEKSAFRAGPRMVQYLKTEALVIHPEEFVVVLSNEIQKFKEYERSTTIKQKNPETGKRETVEAEVYEPSIRLNVTSDFAPEMFKPLFDAHPDVVFYDYTKLQGKPIAENHHLTYSSTGFAQMIDGKLVQHKTNNWNAMRGKLDSGYNVAMAFTSKSALPKTVMDEETGKSYQVWDGDNYDARYLDPKRPDGVGMIVGLRNKAGTMKERESAAQTDGFFVNYDPKTDGDTVSVPDQKALTGRKVIPIAKASLRTAPDTPEFKRFFGDSKVVDADGNPMVVYHATPKNFTFFDPKKLTKNTKHPTARLGFFTATDPSSTDEFIRIPYGIGKGMYEEGANVMPVYASIKNPAVINSGEFVMQSMALQNMKKKDADRFIDDYIQSLRDEGHDGILIKGNKSGRGLAGGNEFTSDNWVALDNTQFKSAIGNTGAYGQRVPTLEEAKALGITQKKAAELQEKGDVRFSLRTAPDTPEFKRFFGDSRVVNDDGTPKVLYHGSARDIGSFKRKTDRGVPIFLTDDPTFAEKFSKDSMAWMTAHPNQFLTETQIKEGRARAIVAIRKDFKQDTQGKEMIDSLKSGTYGDATAEAQEYLRKAYKDMMPSGPNIVAVYVKAEKPFDYQNPSHVKRVLSELSDGEDMRKDVQRGSWETIESESVQDAIKFAGFDSFYVEEGGRKNLAVYDSSQIKSATGNVGAYGQRPVTKEEAAQSGMTQEEAQQAQAEGDIRYSLRTSFATPEAAERAASKKEAPKTETFKQFFAGSQVEKDGRPQVMYHASPNEFSIFSDRKPIFVSPDAEDAQFFSATKRLGKGAKRDYIYPLWVRAQTPFDYENPNHVQMVVAKLAENFTDPAKGDRIQLATSVDSADKITKSLEDGRWTYIEDGRIQDAIKELGFDSFYVSEGNTKNLAVFSPNQVKSVTGNEGAFDLEQKDIRYSLREFRKDDLPKDKKTYTIPANTTLFHGSHKTQAEQIEAAGRVLRSRSDVKASGGYTNEGGLIFFGDSKTAEDWAKNKGDPGSVRFDQEAGVIRDTGTVFQTITDKPYRLIKRRYELSASEAAKVTEALGLPEYKSLSAGDTASLAADRGDNFSNSKAPRYEVTKAGRKQTMSAPWPIIFDALGVDGYFDDFGIAISAKNGIRLEGNDGKMERYSLRTNVTEDIKNMPNGAAIDAAINRTTQARQEVGHIERMASVFMPESFGYLRQKALDRYDRLSSVEREVAKKMGGVERLADLNAHSAALASDLSAGVTASALGVGDRIGGIPVYKDGYTTVSNEGGTIKGAVAIFAPLARYGDPKIYQTYQFWAASKRGKRLLASGKEELFTPQDFSYAKQLEQKYPEFVSVQKDWIKYNDGLVKYLLDTGVISAQNAAEFVKYSDYLPFYRQIDGERTIGPNIFQSISGVKAPKGLSGKSEAPLADFLETIVRNTQASIQAGMKNVAAKKAADAGVFIGLVEKLDHVSSSPSTITILEKGKKVSYECADRLWVDAVSSLNLPELPFLSIFAKPADLLRNLITKDPGFMLANLMRDSVSAYVTSGAKITPLVSTMKEFGSVLMNSSPEYQKLLSAGVLGGYEFSRDIEASTSEFAKDIRKKTGTKTTFETAASPFTLFWGALEKGTTASDAATRIAIYKATLKETGNEAEALHRSLEVLNFNRKGSSAVVRIAAAVIPFLNARVQGLDVFFRSGIRPFFNKDATAMEKQVQKAMFIRGSTIMAMSAMYAAAIAGNPDYENQEEEVKDNNWIIPLGEGRAPLKIPTPFEVGTLFKTLPERIYRRSLGMDTNKDSAEAAKRALSNTFGISPLPQFIAPYYEVKSNYSLFTGREIVSGNMKDVAEEYQIGPNTSKVAQEIGMATGMSPMKIEYLYKGYTGTMGMYALDVLDASITSLMPNSGVQRASKRFEQMPVIKRFFADPEARGKITAYYDLKNSVDSVVRTINFLEKSNDPSIADYAQKNAMLYAAKDFINDLNKQMQDLQDQANMIRTADIPADQKRDILLEITKAQNLLVNDIRAIRKVIQP